MFVLATDLDGTFLGGSLKERNVLYQFIHENRNKIVLVFVTGRALSNVKPIIDDASVPSPDYVIANVGASVTYGDASTPLEPLDSDMERLWVGETAVLSALPRDLNLERQQQDQDRRCSFYTEDHSLVSMLRAMYEPLGCSVAYSAGKYLDILPLGVNKGYTLTRLVEQLKINPEDVLVAGDTLNDLSMFTDTPFRGVVVGNGEESLLQKTHSRSDTYHAVGQGTNGILEAITRFQYFPKKRVAPKMGDASLVLVYHRQPFDEFVEADKLVRRYPKSPNGIIPTLLGLFKNHDSGAWIAWSKCQQGMAGNFQKRIKIELNGTPLTVSRLPLSENEVSLFYQQFSKEALWPIIHGFVERTNFNHYHWQHFARINRLFAEQAASEAKMNALVWVHDYNLWLVPKYLREIRPDVRIAFFHHTPFPSGDTFNILPWARDIIDSLMACNYVGFHIPRYAQNFVDTVATHFSLDNVEYGACHRRFAQYGSALALGRQPREIQMGGKKVSLGAHPVGLDPERIMRAVENEKFHDSVVVLKREQKGKKLIICAERLDYMKGPLNKLLAFEKFLALYPVWREKISFVNICTPPTAGMSIYDDICYEVERAVGRINGKFSTPSWTPITYMFKPVAFETLAVYLGAADIAWITPLRDGLNLVAKEFVAIHQHLDCSGSVIISEFAGASVEMDGALLTNPYDCSEMAHTLEKALVMPLDQQKLRMYRLATAINTYDVHHWSKSFIDAAEEKHNEVLAV